MPRKSDSFRESLGFTRGEIKLNRAAARKRANLLGDCARRAGEIAARLDELDGDEVRHAQEIRTLTEELETIEREWVLV